MKGFPNQVADLTKLRTGMRALAELVDSGGNAKDDGVFGEALVRCGVAGTGHVPIPIEQYLRQQKLKPRSSQSFRTTARGLRELFRLLRLIEDYADDVYIRQDGRVVVEFAGDVLVPAEVDFWRRVISNMTHDAGGSTSHPYQALLKLVARRPGIGRAKCALALEARDDSPEELDRIVALADLDERAIILAIGVTQSNWDNAKKVLPKFAEQLGDVVLDGGGFRIADAPGRAVDWRSEPTAAPPSRPRAPRTSRSITPSTVARAGTTNQDHDAVSSAGLDPVAAGEAIRKRLDRLRRHNMIVQDLATRVESMTSDLFEDPFDLLAIVESDALVFEVKTLDGTHEDETARVRDALAQLLYYETFVILPKVGDAQIRRIAVFESRISEEHRTWLNLYSIGVVWVDSGRYCFDELAQSALGGALS